MEWDYELNTMTDAEVNDLWHKVVDFWKKHRREPDRVELTENLIATEYFTLKQNRIPRSYKVVKVGPSKFKILWNSWLKKLLFSI